MTSAAATMERTAPVQAWDQPGPAPGAWPMYAALPVLGALLTAPSCGRTWTRVLIGEWHLADLADTAELLVSELLTNAVQASRQRSGAVVHLSLASDGVRLLIMVRDFEEGAPSPRHAGVDDEDGRGLTLVDTLSSRYGWSPPADGTTGKVVWAIL
jgi:anti-sigma regulatory factor (Ser/Thr protein kinase)